jgi:DNA-binding response OmpR family regulator
VQRESSFRFGAPSIWRATPSNRILLVDDDSTIRRLSAQALTRSGYAVSTAEDGQAGWDALRAESFHLLITDNRMPRLSGLELVQRVRAARIALPIIMASGSLNAEELNRNRWLRLAATLSKPFTSDQLVATVQEVLRAAPGMSSAGGLYVPTLAETFSHITPYPHWGINE